jgi:hypothetical protein
MSRSGYTDDIDDVWAWIRYRGRVSSALRGERGQRFLRDLIRALEAMPVRELIPNTLEASGQYCALGAVARSRGLNPGLMDTEDHDQLAQVFNVASVLAREVMYVNDDGAETDEPDGWIELHGPVRGWEQQPMIPVYEPGSPEARDRWGRVHRWAVSHLREEQKPTC